MAEQQCCAACGWYLDEDRWAQVEAPCGHGYHLTCALTRVEAGHDAEVYGTGGHNYRACNACTSLTFSKTEGLALLHAECSEAINHHQPTDVELWLGSEVRRGRPMVRLTTMPSSILCLRGLRCLDLTCHPITTLPSEIACLASLKRLVLIALYIEDLPDCIGDLRLLQQLLVSGCPLRRVPPTVAKLDKVWDFYFDANNLATLPEMLPPNIDGVKVSGNVLTCLPDTLGQCTSVTNIRAYGNCLTSVPASLCSLGKLCEISMQGNRLRSLPEALGNLAGLRYLSLHDNCLESLPESLVELVELRWLYVYNNRLSKLPDALFSKLQRLERVLVEANPFTEQASTELFSTVPDGLRTLGVDASQVGAYFLACEGSRQRVLPPCVVSGWMLPWGRLYGKLTPASQLRRSADVQAVHDGTPAFGGDVLVVAFAASQAEPEWFGVLGQVLRSGVSLAESRASIGRGAPVQSFGRVYEELHGTRFDTDRFDADSIQRAVAAAWLPPPEDGSVVQGGNNLSTQHVAQGTAASCVGGGATGLCDFDVLSLCDTNAQWYYDAPSRLQLGVEAKLKEISQHYRRVLLLGVSMGGFGALSHAHLASTVLALGLQTDLTMSHLRPGLSPRELEDATAKLRRGVEAAIQAGVRIEYHVAMEEHLVYARQLPLPRGSLVVHPVEGRIARLLEQRGVLVPLLVDVIGELQEHGGGGIRPWRDGSDVATSTGGRGTHLRDHAFDWSDAEERILLALWHRSGALSFAHASGRQLAILCRKPPTNGEWFCAFCRVRNGERTNLDDGNDIEELGVLQLPLPTGNSKRRRLEEGRTDQIGPGSNAAGVAMDLAR